MVDSHLIETCIPIQVTLQEPVGRASFFAFAGQIHTLICELSSMNNKCPQDLLNFRCNSNSYEWRYELPNE